MKIACWGYYGKQNLGDDLILAELYKHIRANAPNADVLIFSDEQFAENVSGGDDYLLPAFCKGLAPGWFHTGYPDLRSGWPYASEGHG